MDKRTDIWVKYITAQRHTQFSLNWIFLVPTQEISNGKPLSFGYLGNRTFIHRLKYQKLAAV